MKKKEIITFVIVFVVAILSTIFFLKPHYSIDTVEFLTNGYDRYIQDKFLVDGRIFSVLLLKLVIDLPMRYVMPITYIIGILISCLSVMYLRKIMIGYTKTEGKINIIPTMISYIIIFNFMYIDAFQFMELPIIALSILLFTIAAKIILEKKKHYILKGFILTLIAMFCYQGTMSVFIVTTFILLLIKNQRLNKAVILEMIKAGIFLVIAILINYGFTTIFGGTNRIDFNILENCKNAFINLYMIIFDSNNHYPVYLQFVFALIIITYCLIKKIKISNLLWIYCISIAVNLILLMTSSGALMPSFVQWGRVFFTIGALIGYIFMYLWCTSNIIIKDKFIKSVLIIYFLTLIITYLQYTYFYMKGQQIDEYIITNIDKVITEYEKENGIKIKNYAYRIDFDNYEILETSHILNKEYKGINYTTIYNGRRTNEGISKSLFLLYANRRIGRTAAGEEFPEEYFENMDLKNMELFDEKRFVFRGDTVYIMF